MNPKPIKRQELRNPNTQDFRPSIQNNLIFRVHSHIDYYWYSIKIKPPHDTFQGRKGHFVKEGSLDHYKRHQGKYFSMYDVFEQQDKRKCKCGCGQKLTGRRTVWATDECSGQAYYVYAILNGDTGIIRDKLYERDKGFCKKCGVESKNWDADHIIPVHLGGGGCGLDNFQTLCKDCHLEKTVLEAKNRSNNA